MLRPCTDSEISAQSWFFQAFQGLSPWRRRTRIRMRCIRLQRTTEAPACCSNMNPTTAPTNSVLMNVTMMFPQFSLTIPD